MIGIYLIYLKRREYENVNILRCAYLFLSNLMETVRFEFRFMFVSRIKGGFYIIYFLGFLCIYIINYLLMK